MLSLEPASGKGRSRATGKLTTLCNPPYSLTNEIAEAVSDDGSANRSNVTDPARRLAWTARQPDGTR
jgi:hypothetical protein